jgi:hypothetical protein
MSKAEIELFGDRLHRNGIIKRTPYARIVERLTRIQQRQAHRPEPGLSDDVQVAVLLDARNQVRRNVVDNIDASGLQCGNPR